MKHSKPLDDQSWWTIAQYYRGALSWEEQTAVERHFDQCATCLEEFRALSSTLDPTALDLAGELEGESTLADPGALIEMVRLRLAETMGVEVGSTSDARTKDRGNTDRDDAPSRYPAAERPQGQSWKQWVPIGEGLQVDREVPWEPTGIQGIEVKRLHVARDRQSVTMRIRMAPGTSYPAHRHGGREQCFVIQGDLHAGERVMTAGDFEVVEEGSEHPVQWTEHGCELLIVSSTRDTLL